MYIRRVLGISIIAIGVIGLIRVHGPTPPPPGILSSWRTGTVEGPGRDICEGARACLRIPRINVHVPVHVNVPIDNEREYNEVLRGGVALARGSATLDSLTGNSFIFGHSGRLTLQPSYFDTVFASLDELQETDEIILEVDGIQQRFQVFESSSRSAKDISILEQKEERIVTLMTCWPLNSTAKRWVVQARPA
ncbi:MAG: sortase [bacterium]|nr:sortase [bacterium]